MKKLFILLIPVIIAGCQSIDYIKKDPKTGTITEEYHQSGFPNFSSGVGKNLPFSNPSFSVISK